MVRCVGQREGSLAGTKDDVEVLSRVPRDLQLTTYPLFSRRFSFLGGIEGEINYLYYYK